jgi:hypothetical protein
MKSHRVSIISWIWKHFVAARVEVIPDRVVQIGFTRFGPIFNLNLAFTSERRSAILSKLFVEITHEKGETHVFQWASVRETFSEISDPLGNRQTVAKEQNPIAFKIGVEVLSEKFVMFQEEEFYKRLQENLDAVAAQVAYLRTRHENPADEILNSKEQHELIDAHKKALWWKPGRYIVKFGITTTGKASMNPKSFSFHLSSLDIDILANNLPLVERDYENIVRGAWDQGYQFATLAWNWRSIKLHAHNERSELQITDVSPSFPQTC